jgi:2-polyprenyl-3-methyl-5-hydroxy-6-metoxy-1,4-benzoquinol methylase
VSHRKNCCAQCEGIELTFNEEAADEDLRLYRAEGPDEATGWLLDELIERGVEGLTLLDIGGGVGAIQHELLENGAASAVHVDASSAYIEAAQREAKRRKLRERIEWRHGDFVDIARELQPADIVTLDKVICCYDDMPSLVRASVRKAQQYYAIVVPRDNFAFKTAAWFMNLIQAITRNPYRMFVHPTKQIDAIVKRAGLSRTFERHDWMWQAIVYSK